MPRHGLPIAFAAMLAASPGARADPPWFDGTRGAIAEGAFVADALTLRLADGTFEASGLRLETAGVVLEAADASMEVHPWRLTLSGARLRLDLPAVVGEAEAGGAEVTADELRLTGGRFSRCAREETASPTTSTA